jgi:hypothetical protein
VSAGRGQSSSSVATPAPTSALAAEPPRLRSTS